MECNFNFYFLLIYLISRGNERNRFAVYLRCRRSSQGLFWYFLHPNVYGGLRSYYIQDEQWCKKESPYDVRALSSVHIWHRSDRKIRCWQGYQGVPRMVNGHEKGAPWWRWDTKVVILITYTKVVIFITYTRQSMSSIWRVHNRVLRCHFLAQFVSINPAIQPFFLCKSRSLTIFLSSLNRIPRDNSGCNFYWKYSTMPLKARFLIYYIIL